MRYVLFLFFYASTALAYNSGASFGQVAQSAMEPVSVFSQFLDAACFIIGGGFFFASIIKYIEHRRSPLMVSISTVIFLFISSLFLLALPFLYLLMK